MSEKKSERIYYDTNELTGKVEAWTEPSPGKWERAPKADPTPVNNE